MEAEAAFQSGATALFEEKYGDRVRVISLADFSKELCGGNHTDRTGNIGLFKIVSESSVASGVRRMEAITGNAAVEQIQHTNHVVRDAARILKDTPDSLVQKLEGLIAGQKNQEKEIERLKAKLVAMQADETADRIQEVDGVSLLVKRVAVDTPAALRDLADRYRDKLKSGVIVLGSAVDSKVLLIAVVTKDLTDRFHAGNIVKSIAPVVGGGGGGRPDMAQAGGSKPENLDQSLKKAEELLGVD